MALFRAIKSPAEGFLLMDSSFKPVYVNDEAVQILAYPENPRDMPSVNTYIAKKIRALISRKRSSFDTGCVTEVTSGKRRYLCRAFTVTSHPNNNGHQQRVAVLIERCPQVPSDLVSLIEHYRLTPREREVIEYLAKGLTSKEIASRMNISANTVKAFLRLVMVKMGVSSRARIIGKIF